ncbi:hypothetical protein [Arachidicoccus ginsenosidimutans]|uniref:hypothetical protein n=1 Tax=Arachidicoccus sp. BS20 TaxID=1850526 RepID=UPI000A83AB48|nr:hypothetical protein [Arachidicoccus sp. BS20]
MRKVVFSCFLLFCIAKTGSCQSPRIVNIVNFIRLLEPRDPAITEDVLYQTVVNQIALMRKCHLGGTFLLQYDALMDARYQKLLKALPRDSFEIGAWWEIPQPLVENSGMKWRGRYPWDWRANVGFSTGYTPGERRKLIDTYMKDFKKIFGYYPKSVASWFIDAYSLQYMYNKYHIVASANCKDQYGTDGYTLWGGYWNQAYYPSKVNVYMPAQHKNKQIPVPVFRMLGSDPIHQYDDGLEQSRQGVITLEPVYPRAGGNAVWINWFLKQFVNGASMAFAYTQAGQENSFTWNAMAKGLELQFPLIEKLRDEKQVRVETLAESGQWFKKHFLVTPSTSVTALEDVRNGNKKTVWFNSRYYRANLLWENGALRFRDIHLFDENLVSPYFQNAATSNECRLFTLPFVDGYLWSKENKRAGLEFKTIIDGKNVLVDGNVVSVDDSQKGILKISWQLKNIPGILHIEFTERQIAIYLDSNIQQKWYLELETADSVNLPFQNIVQQSVQAVFEKTSYKVEATQGTFSKAAGSVFRLTPENNKILLKL